jgi:transposase
MRIRITAAFARDLGWIEGAPKPIGSRIPGHTLSGHIQIAFLPPYAPDLNPVEYLWAWLKRHALANYYPNDLGELQSTARKKLKSAQKRAFHHRRLLDAGYALVMSLFM